MLHSFNGTSDGDLLLAGVILDKRGDLYGTTAASGGTTVVYFRVSRHCLLSSGWLRYRNNSRLFPVAATNFIVTYWSCPYLFPPAPEELYEERGRGFGVRPASFIFFSNRRRFASRRPISARIIFSLASSLLWSFWMRRCREESLVSAILRIVSESGGYVTPKIELRTERFFSAEFPRASLYTTRAKMAPGIPGGRARRRSPIAGASSVIAALAL